MEESSGPYTIHTMDNGLQVVIERMPSVRSAAAGFFVRTGARDEVLEPSGLAMTANCWGHYTRRWVPTLMKTLGLGAPGREEKAYPSWSSYWA